MAPKNLKDFKRVFQGAQFDVRVTELSCASGKTVTREVVIHPGAVVVLPIVDSNTIIMIRNERFAVGETLWELPAGTLEPEEPPEETAKRELIEETGYRCEQLHPLTTFYTTPGFCNETMVAYVAEGLSFVGQNLDDDEEITVEPLKWDDILKMIRGNEIRDGKSLAALLYFNTFYR